MSKTPARWKVGKHIFTGKWLAWNENDDPFNPPTLMDGYGGASRAFPTWRKAMDYADTAARTIKVTLPRPIPRNTKMTNNTTPETTPVKLSNLTPEERQECIGMWATWQNIRKSLRKGIILGVREVETIIYDPRSGIKSRALHSRVTLLPDYQRAFTADGHPTSIDPGQWAKTHDMEDEIDRITTNSDPTDVMRALQAIMDTATHNGIPIAEALLTPGGDITLFFDKEHN